MPGPAFAVGQTVELNDGRNAIVRFYGSTAFAPGQWIGVELGDATGKNDGSVKGDRYFDCEPAHGMFLRAAGVSRIIEQTQSRVERKTEGSHENGTGTAVGKSRSSGAALQTKRTGVDKHKRESMAASPTPSRPGTASQLSGLRSPSKSPTKQLGSASSSASTSRTGTPPTVGTRGPSTATKPRSSLAPPTTLSGRRTSTVPASSATTRASSRPSVVGATARVPASTRPLAAPAASSRQPVIPQKVPIQRLSSISAEDQSDAASQRSSVFSPNSETSSSRAYTPEVSEEQESVEDLEQTPRQPAATSTVFPHSSQTDAPGRTPSHPAVPAPQRADRVTATYTRDMEDLSAKVRLLEKRRLEDRDKLKTLDRVQQERDRFEAIIQKLQAKYQPQQQELTDLKRQLQESESRFADIENIQAEHDAELENATLDREMAEEQYEVLKTELVALRDKNEELELELEVLKEENQELSAEMSPEERTSQGWLQLERSNERLREALLRLREVTQEQESELREQVKGLERDVEQLTTANNESSPLKEKLLESVAAIDDLKQQLEAAQGGEEMIEELSDRNLALQEQLEDLKTTIEDLESLKELNDELDINHVEAEKQMQEEMDFKDTVIADQTRHSHEQQKTIDDYEMTLSRFREAFRSLQGDLEDMRASQQISEIEAEDLTSKSRALMDLNMKLQTSASKTQVKAIDLELRRLDAEEASEHLAVVQLYLPEAYKAERDSVAAFLRLKRIAFKANVIRNTIKERIASQGSRRFEEDVFVAYGVLDKLAWVSAMSDRFIADVRTCSVATFANYQGALYELEPVERALNTYLDGLRKDELRAKEVDEELQRSIAVMSHLAPLHMEDSPANSADDAIMRTWMLQTYLETASSALSIIKAQVIARSALTTNDDTGDTDDDDSDDEDEMRPFFQRIDALISECRNVKVVAARAHRDIAELSTRGLGLDLSLLQTFSAAETQARRVAAFACEAGQRVISIDGDGEREEKLSLRNVGKALMQAAVSTFGLKSAEPEPFSTVSSDLRSLGEQTSYIVGLSSDLSNTSEFERGQAPWVTRSTEVKAARTSSAETEAEAARLTEALRDRSLLVRTKEQELEEQSVRIEMLEARMKDAGKRSAQVANLENSLREMKTSGVKMMEDVERQRRDVARLRNERDDWRRTAEDLRNESTAHDDGVVGAIGRASKLELDRTKLQVSGLQAAVRFLHREKENARQRGPTDSALNAQNELDWLSEPLLRTKASSERRGTLVQKEGKAVLYELLKMTCDAEYVDLAKLGKDKLAWRPVRQKSAWITQRAREDWEVWKEWRGDVKNKASDMRRPAGAYDGHGSAAPVREAKAGLDGLPVRILGSPELEDLRDAVEILP